MHERRAKLERARNAIRAFNGDGATGTRSRSGSCSREGRLFGRPQRGPGTGLTSATESDADLDPDARPPARPYAQTYSGSDADLDPDTRPSYAPNGPCFAAFPSGCAAAGRHNEADERQMKLERARLASRRASQGLPPADDFRTNDPALRVSDSMASMDLFMASVDGDLRDSDLRPVDARVEGPRFEEALPNDAGFFESDDEYDDSHRVGQTAGVSAADVVPRPSSPVRPRPCAEPQIGRAHV